MNWPRSILVGLVTGASGALGAGTMASQISAWNRGLENGGPSGYLVFSLALVGLLLGLAIGVVGGRRAGGPGTRGFLRGLWHSLAITLGIVGAVGALAFVLTDHSPPHTRPALDLDLDLEVEVEVQCPPDFQPLAQESLPASLLELVSPSNGLRRVGVFDLGRATQVEGRWTIPGRVALPPSPANRLLRIQVAPLAVETHDIPLPPYPRQSMASWSDWLPRSTEPRSNPASLYLYRYRLQPRTAGDLPAKSGAIRDRDPAPVAPEPPQLTTKQMETSGKPGFSWESFASSISSAKVHRARPARSFNGSPMIRTPRVPRSLRNTSPVRSRRARSARRLGFPDSGCPGSRR